MKRIIKSILLVQFLIVSNYLYAQEGWYSIQSGTIYNLYNVYFTDNSTGYIVGDRIILKTINSGLNWQISSQSNSNILLGIYFIDSNTGCIVGSNGTILKTTNSGLIWNVQNYGYVDWLNSVCMIDVNHIVAVGTTINFDQYVILKTTNGGINWDRQTSLNSRNLTGVKFLNSNTGFISGGDGVIMKTTNFGGNWIYEGFNGSPNFSSIYMIDQNTGYATADSGKIAKTIDSQNWNILSCGTNLSLNGLTFLNANTGYIVGNSGIILKTSNGGLNWLNQVSGTTNRLLKVFFTDANTGYAIGNNGTILKTVSGGVGIKKVSNTIPNKFCLYQNYPNPFNPSTKIKFDINENNSKSNLSIYDLAGRKIETLVNETLNKGSYEIDWDSKNYSSGVYIYQLKINHIIEFKKMIVNK